MHPLRRRLEQSDRLAGLIGRIAAGYLRLCLWSNRWTRDGFDELRAALAEGPVVIVMWHSRILLAPAHLGPTVRLTTLRDPSPAGRVSAAMQRRFGMDPIAMSANASNTAASREVLRRLKAGQSVGMTADGPLGPARVMKSAPLDWSRVSGAPLFLFAYACTRQGRLGTWDGMLVPRLFGRGHVGIARWPETLPRRADSATQEQYRAALEAALTAHQAAVDTALGVAVGP